MVKTAAGRTPLRQPEASPAIQPIDDAELDFEIALAIGIAQELVETLILEQGVPYEQVIEALGGLSDSGDD